MNVPLQSVDEELESPSSSPNINVQVSTSFPSSEIFGVKLVNGHPTQALVSFSNDEPGPVTVAYIGGSLWTQDPLNPDESRIVRNLTATRYNVEIPAGAKESLSYSFATELHPQDLRLSIVAILSDSDLAYYTLQPYNETVSIVEADTSIFDPQM